MTSPDQDAAALLQSLGLKLTRPRLRVISLLLARKEGEPAMSAEQVYLALDQGGAGASPGTIYRTLALLASRGVIERQPLPDGRHAYARRGTPVRHHMRVADSGEVFSFSDELLEARLGELARESGFQYLKSELLVHVCSPTQRR